MSFQKGTFLDLRLVVSFVMPTALPYVRTSTDDKQQNPDRQVSDIKAWAEREGVSLLAPVIDEGSSASKDIAFERDLFVEACERAQAEGADAVVMEKPDRLTRLDSDLFSWHKVELGNRYGLKVWFTKWPLDFQSEGMGRMLAQMEAEQGHQWVQSHSERVKSGMRQARKEGRHVGRPRKTCTREELALVRELREQGTGWRSVAVQVNKARGVPDLATEAARRARRVSFNTVRRWMEDPDKYLEPES